jgi:hypothetical protein
MLAMILARAPCSTVLGAEPLRGTSIPCFVQGGSVRVKETATGYLRISFLDENGKNAGTMLARASDNIVIAPTGSAFGYEVTSAKCQLATATEISDSSSEPSCSDPHDIHMDNGIEPMLVSAYGSRTGLFISVASDEISMFGPESRRPTRALLSIVVDGASKGIIVTEGKGNPTTIFLPGLGLRGRKITLRTLNYVTGTVQVEQEREYCLMQSVN